jgi:GNAT superfamily N-acetyltransferase
MNINFKFVNGSNFKKYEHLIMETESIFPESIRSDLEDIKFMLEDQFEPIGIAMFVGEEYAGFAVGSKIDDDEVDGYGFDMDLSGKKILYFFDITVMPKFQGNGIGKQLFNRFILETKEKGYDVVLGHYRTGKSTALIKKLGAIETRIEPNWEDSGEDYAACILYLADVSKESLLSSAKDNLVKYATMSANNEISIGTHST